MKSNKYWEERKLRRFSENEQRTTEYVKSIRKMYEQASRNIKKMLDDVYKNYSNDTGIDKQKLRELLTKSETEKHFEELKKIGLEKYVKDNYKSRINRLEKIQLELYKATKDLYKKEELKHSELYKEVINNGYYKAIYDTQIGVGYDFNFSNLDKNLIKSLMSEKWHGLNYSERIWNNTEIIANQIKDIVGGGLLSGQSIQKTARLIRERFDVGKFYSERLVRTESNYFHNQADLMAYEEMEVEYYTIIATLDNRTSKICQEKDGKKFKVTEALKGKNFPPFHVNCRTTTSSYIDEETEKLLVRRARNPITGKNEVIDNVSYEEWLKGINTLKNQPINGIINVEIDELTPCLLKKSTNEYVDTIIKKMDNSKELKKLTKGWKFDWTIEKNILGLYSIDNKERLQGLMSYEIKKEDQAVFIKLLENNPDNVKNKTYKGVGGHLIAEACKISFDNGFDGYVYLDAKTSIIEHYKKYGAKQVGLTNRMLFETNEARNLIERYYEKEKR